MLLVFRVYQLREFWLVYPGIVLHPAWDGAGKSLQLLSHKGLYCVIFVLLPWCDKDFDAEMFGIFAIVVFNCKFLDDALYMAFCFEDDKNMAV
jgi:hypothetical protein